MRLTSLFVAALSSIILARCADAQTSTVHGADSTASAQNTITAKPDQSKLSGDEIAGANLPTAYEVVERLRRPWLRKDALTGGDVAVYMDGRIVGCAETLRDIPSVDVAAPQYLPNDEAVRRWGSDIKGSVVVITRRR